MTTTCSMPDTTELILIGQFRKCQSIQRCGRHGFRGRIWSGPILASGDISIRAMLKLGLMAGYEETETFRYFIKIISKTQTELSDSI